jgi:glycolate oxidase FAD binding subunit
VTADLNIARKALTGVSASVREGSEADTVGRVVPSLVASPASVDEASALLRIAAEHALTVVPRGGGSRLGWGTPVTSCDLLVDMGRMDAVVEHTAGDLVARVQAGARMGDVASALAGAAGQEIALDVPPSATVGGVIASALAGPRRLRYGSPRDLLIGVTIVRADGTVAHSGGKVVKNVAGYDLGKLLAGSWGTLGLIAEATFRLHPLPAAQAFVTAEFADVKAASGAVGAAAASPLVASAVELRRASPGGPVQVGVLLEGSAEGVVARATRMSELLGSGAVSPKPPEWWPAAKRVPDGGTLIQVSFWVSALESVLDTVDRAAREHSVAPVVGGAAGAGVIHVGLGPAADAGAAGRFAGALRERLSHARGGVVVLTAPGSVREALGSYGGMTGPVPALRLMQAVRDQFDPDHRMSPGRFPAEGA